MKGEKAKTVAKWFGHARIKRLQILPDDAILKDMTGFLQVNCVFLQSSEKLEEYKSMSQTPRHINTDRSLSRPDQGGAAPSGCPGTTEHPAALPGAARPAGSAAPLCSTARSGRLDRTAPPQKKKKTPLWLPFAIVMGVIAVISGRGGVRCEPC